MGTGSYLQNRRSRYEGGPLEHLMPLQHLATEPCGSEGRTVLKRDLLDQLRESRPGLPELALEPFHFREERTATRLCEVDVGNRWPLLFASRALPSLGAQR